MKSNESKRADSTDNTEKLKNTTDIKPEGLRQLTWTSGSVEGGSQRE